MGTNKPYKHHIPFPSGPFATGCIELMTEYSAEGCFARIFYPTDISSNKLNEYSDKWIPWIPDETYLKGFAECLRIPFCIFKYGPSIIRLKPYYIPTIFEAQPSKTLKSFPIFIFSHGFGATRFVNSEYCNSLASHGFFVVAIEHRDTSSPATFYYDSPESAKNDNRTWVNHVQFHKIIGPDHYYQRNKQLKYRFKEMKKIIDTIFKINSGEVVDNVFNPNFDLLQFKNKLDVDNIVGSGFSFGGATAMYTAANDKRIKSLVIVDGWMFSLKSEPNLSIEQSILFINTHTFHLESNIAIIKKYMASNSFRQLYTLKNTTHESPTDTAYIWGHWLDLFMIKKMNSETALRLQSSLTLRYLNDRMNYPENVDGLQIYIKEHSDKIVSDTIKYSKRVKRKMGIWFW
ncbi:platelet-activating factor acetylhydrolase-like [Daktulosphaira vitifoliae]|uniref:platelet-activating factor acetylhydrolase-like n=1 Tax=Daktulosphaira vitifoliae TaxID=58002 RepID=UPI0021A987E4|nr:platelet-activating factor acetylhydrolase-like [Daktulosphaira vitifoliae]